MWPHCRMKVFCWDYRISGSCNLSALIVVTSCIQYIRFPISIRDLRCMRLTQLSARLSSVVGYGTTVPNQDGSTSKASAMPAWVSIASSIHWLPLDNYTSYSWLGLSCLRRSWGYELANLCLWALVNGLSSILLSLCYLARDTQKRSLEMSAYIRTLFSPNVWSIKSYSTYLLISIPIIRSTLLS